MTLPPPSDARLPRAKQCGSVLLVAMLIATAVGIGLAGYLNLSYNELKLAQRTFYLNDAANLAEAGLEEAVYCFRLASAGTATSTAWRGWTLSGNNASLTLPSFNRSQNAVCTVKVYVTGYNGSSGATGAVGGNGSNRNNNNTSGTGTSTTTSSSSIIAQATIAPLDGSPTVMKTLKVTLSGTSSGSSSTSSGTGNGGNNQSGNSSGTGAIPVGTTTSTTWKLTNWYDLQGTSESRTLSTTTGGFLK